MSQSEYNPGDQRIIDWCRERANDLREYEHHEMAMCLEGDYEGAMMWALRALGNGLGPETTAVFAAIRARRQQLQSMQAQAGVGREGQ